LLRRPSPLVLLHGRDIHDGNDFAKMLDHTGTVIDPEVYGNLSFWQEARIPRGLSLTWIRINPDVYTFLMDPQTNAPAAYINAMPVGETAYAKIRGGTLVDNAITADDIVPYDGSSTIKIYMMSIAVAERYRRWGDGVFQISYMQLLTGFFDKLIWYAKRHRVRVTHLLASAWTPEGRRICQSFGMAEVGKDRYGDTIFELDLETLGRTAKGPPSLKNLLKAYVQLES
jgi:hypothetical protein